MKSPQRAASAEHIVKRTLADGTVKEYRYSRHRRAKQQAKAADSLHALIEAYQCSPEWNGLADATRAQYELYLRPLFRVGHIAVDQIKRRDLKLVRDRIARERGNGAAHGFSRAASSLFTFAVDRDWIEASPATMLTKGLPRGHLRAWTPEEAVPP